MLETEDGKWSWEYRFLQIACGGMWLAKCVLSSKVSNILQICMLRVTKYGNINSSVNTLVKPKLSYLIQTLEKVVVQNGLWDVGKEHPRKWFM